MSGIRVTYSGLVSFGINLISVVTGLVFTLIVTRKLSVEEFGTWGLINGIIIQLSPIGFLEKLPGEKEPLKLPLSLTGYLV